MVIWTNSLYCTKAINIVWKSKRGIQVCRATSNCSSPSGSELNSEVTLQHKFCSSFGTLEKQGKSELVLHSQALSALTQDRCGRTDWPVPPSLPLELQQTGLWNEPMLRGAQGLMPQRFCCVNLYGHCMVLKLLTYPVEITETQEKNSWRKKENPVIFLLSNRMMSPLVRRQTLCAFSARTWRK